MHQLLRLYRQTRDVPTPALYLVTWLRLACEGGLLTEDQALRALQGNTRTMAALLAAAQPGVRAYEAAQVLETIERELAV